MVSKFRSLPPAFHLLFRLATVVGLLLAISQIFRVQALIMVENRFLYLLLVLFFSFAFLLYPARQKDADGIPWYDVLAFLMSVAAGLYLASNALNIITFAWEYNAPLLAVIVSVVFWILILEAVRRTGGRVLFFVLTIFSLYPLYAPYLPTFISGTGYSLTETATFHILSTQSVLGLALNVFATIVIGFIVFGVVLQVTGGATFFTDIAMALLGKSRGGPAKMAVLSSGLMGSISGSVISNVLTTGAVTIPLMKRVGYPPRFAAAIEACASTGGVLMPPVMGATAFVMASFLGVPYAQVMIAAVIPSLLYYYSLTLQVDAVAARIGLPGLKNDEIPSVWETLRRGWPFILALGLLIYMIIVLKIEARAPFVVSAVLLLITLFNRARRLSLAMVLELIDETGKLLVELVVLLSAVGFVLGSLSVTGMAQAVARELIHLAGNNPLLLLLMGAVTSFVLGMGMTITACYVFLAVVLAPALVQLGFNPIAAHLFILYWGMLSFITPPVALGVFTAAALADADPMRTGIEAVRMGIMLYLLPFFFVFNPMMVLQGDLGWGIVLLLVNSCVGIWLLAGGLQGYLSGIGQLGFGSSPLGRLLQILAVAGGILLALPQGFGLVDSTVWPGANYLGLLLGLVVVPLCWWFNRRPEKPMEVV